MSESILELIERHKDFGEVKRTGTNRHSEDTYTDYYVGKTVVVRLRVRGVDALVQEMDLQTGQRETMARGGVEFCLRYMQKRYGTEALERCA